MTILHILSLAGYFFCLYEYIAMRHRVICVESDARIDASFWLSLAEAGIEVYEARYYTVTVAQKLYWNRGTK